MVVTVKMYKSNLSVVNLSVVGVIQTIATNNKSQIAINKKESTVPLKSQYSHIKSGFIYP